MTSHVDWAIAEKCLSKHFDKGLTFSTTPLEVSGTAVLLPATAPIRNVCLMCCNRAMRCT